MLCARCSHPLSTRAQRCPRCFALNRDAAAPVAVTFSDEPVTAPDPPAPPVYEESPQVSWLGDGAFLLAAVAACMWATVAAGRVRYPLDFLRDSFPLWLALLAAFGFAYSLVGSLAALPPKRAVARALLSLVSAGLGFYGFALALFDRRGQTLHDKLTQLPRSR